MKTIQEVIEGAIKEIKKELVGKEITLLNMDNTILDILENWGNEVSRDKNSVFGGAVDECVEDGGHAYSFYMGELDDNVNHDIDITFEVLNDNKIGDIATAVMNGNDDIFGIIVKITEVDEI